MKYQEHALDEFRKSEILRPYWPTLLPGLNEDDLNRRLEFYDSYVIQCKADTNIYKTIIWSDEAIFKVY